MSERKISYREALQGVVIPDDVEGMVNLLEQHKNWGAFTAKMPSYIVVSLVDTVKRLKEEAMAAYLPEPPEALDNDVEDGDDEASF
jgi:hypothetical protein